ncbi:MAG: pilus assembly PilX N-terminal domain-containing protein, partial [Candidatus Eremiobacteraeota bacterium]|nr:pilus assembly PilX N-terminal domain-containing protein [Candidatus Eremiobacteraeota bacterium]
MAQKRNQWKLKGVALIMALYLTVILAALGTFFIADQLNKSRTATDSVDSQLALQGANGALNMIVNYFGNTTYDWHDALTLASGASGTASPPTAICPGGTAALENGGNPFPYPIAIEITQVTLNQPVPNANPAMDENQYAFNFSNPIPIPNSGGKVLVIPSLAGHNLINILYYPTQAADTVCGTPSSGSENAAALQSIQIDLVAEVKNAAGAVLATREIQWTGARFSTSALNYPGESSWNGGPGGDPPNYVEGTETDAYIGNGETINGTIFSLADPNTANNSTYGYLTNPSESPYGTDTNGAVSLQDGSSGCNGCPTINPQLNGGVQANGAVSFTNASGTPITGQVNGSESQNTGDAVSSPMGTPWGPATTSSGSPNPNTAPGNMLNAYNQAASNCPGGVQTVFIDASNNIGVGNPGGSGYEVEVPNDYTATDPAVTKPGYAVTDITLNSNNSVTINRYGYYSGAELYSETITPSQLQTLSQSPGGAVLYIQGGNVRVHGNLSSVGLTVAANQGDEFFNSAGQPINSNSTSCVASDNTGSGTVTPTLANAERFNSSLADHAAGNQTNYWIPNACGESGQPGCSPSAFTPSPPTQPCGPCLVDGTYYSS